MMRNISDFINIENKAKRRYYQREHGVFQYRRNVALTLPPEIEDRFSLIPGLDVAHFILDGDRVIVTFSRKGAER